MPARFPPGAMSSKAHRSRWREFSFAFHQVARAIEPRLNLQHCITHWNQIAANLADPPRRRLSHEQLHALQLKHTQVVIATNKLALMGRSPRNALLAHLIFSTKNREPLLTDKDLF